MKSSKRVLLVIGSVWLEPDSTAAGRHLLSLLRLFRERGWEVHFASPAARGEHEVDLAEEEVRAHEIVLNCGSFDEFIGRLQPGAVLFDRYMMEEQFGWRVAKVCPDAMRILDMEDVHSLRQARHEVVKKGLSVEEAELNTELAKREVASIFRSDLSLVISDYEMELLRDRYQVPEQLIVPCPFLLEENADVLPSFDERAHFISIGNFRHAPNWDAVLSLKKDLWPRIRKELPEAELHVYGAYTPPKAKQLHNAAEGFLVKGWAEDSKEVMSSARVCLAPLRFGAGLKGKLVEAMSCGTPSVTTTVGAEGIQGDCVWPGVVTDDLDCQAREAVALYQDRERWVEMQGRGEILLKERFDQEEIAERVMGRVEETYENLTEQREQNFIGQMLQHHSMRASQYMSQWIEAKNRCS